MALKKSLVLFPLLALLLLMLEGAQASLGQETPAMKFQRQHMDTDGSSSNPTYCNRMMSRRNMTQGRCKPVNTFVHETLQDVQNVCQQRNIACKNGSTNCHRSPSIMRATDCRLKTGSRYPNCVYRTIKNNRHIIIACKGNPYVPVHFDPCMEVCTCGQSREMPPPPHHCNPCLSRLPSLP